MSQQQEGGVSILSILCLTFAVLFGALYIQSLQRPRTERPGMDIRELTQLPQDRGVVVRYNVTYTNQPQMLPAVLQQGGSGRVEYPSPREVIFRAMGMGPDHVPGGADWEQGSLWMRPDGSTYMRKDDPQDGRVIW